MEGKHAATRTLLLVFFFSVPMSIMRDYRDTNLFLPLSLSLHPPFVATRNKWVVYQSNKWLPHSTFSSSGSVWPTACVIYRVTFLWTWSRKAWRFCRSNLKIYCVQHVQSRVVPQNEAHLWSFSGRHGRGQKKTENDWNKSWGELSIWYSWRRTASFLPGPYAAYLADSYAHDRTVCWRVPRPPSFPRDWYIVVSS